MANIEKLPEQARALKEFGTKLKPDTVEPHAFENKDIQAAITQAEEIKNVDSSSDREAIIAFFKEGLNKMRANMPSEGDPGKMQKALLNISGVETLVERLQRLHGDASGFWKEDVGGGLNWLNRQRKGAMDLVNSNAVTGWLGLAAIPLGLYAIGRWFKRRFMEARHPIQTFRRWSGRSKREIELEQELEDYKAAARAQRITPGSSVPN